MALVQLENVAKSYGKTEVLRGISASVDRGEVVGIIGPNGGGKSTLLTLIAGLGLPTEGVVTIDGIASHELARKAAGKIGLVTARAGLYPLLSGRENLHFFTGLFGLEPDEIDRRAAPLLEQFNLSAVMDQRVRNWSTGMRQRLSLIRALVPRPEILLFDEPTANLDPLGERDLHAKLREYADEGHAGIIVTHRLEQAERVCDRVWYLEGTIRETIELERAPLADPSGPLFDAWVRNGEGGQR